MPKPCTAKGVIASNSWRFSAAGVDEHLGDRDEVQPLQLSADIPVYLDVLHEQGESWSHGINS